MWLTGVSRLRAAYWLKPVEAAHPCGRVPCTWPRHQQCLICSRCSLLHTYHQRWEDKSYALICLVQWPKLFKCTFNYCILTLNLFVAALEPFFNASASQFILGQSIPLSLWLSLAPVVLGMLFSLCSSRRCNHSIENYGKCKSWRYPKTMSHENLFRLSLLT